MLYAWSLLLRSVRWLVFQRRTSKAVFRYKSGQRQVVRCREISVRKDGGQITSIDITNAYPGWLSINVDQLESLWLT